MSDGHDLVPETAGADEASRRLGPVFGGLKWLVGRLDMATYWLIVVALAAMCVLVSLQVVLRYVFAASLDSADELSRLCFVWVIFLAIPHGIKQGVHVGIDLFVRALPVRFQAVLFRLMAALGMVLMAMLVAGSWAASVDRWPQLMPTLPISSGIYYVAVLACGVHGLLHLGVLAWGGARTWAGELA